MGDKPYTAPVDQLLRLGEPDFPDVESEQPPKDYLAMGLSAADVPELIRLACDEAVRDSDHDPDLYGPLHAWWALGQLRAEAAAQPLLNLLNSREQAGDDYAMEDLPCVLGMIGPAAIGPAGRFLRDSANGSWARGAAGQALEEIGTRFPDHRLAAIEPLRQALEAGDQNETDMNAFLVGDLVELRAVEASASIEHAFAQGWVEEGILGDWDYVKPQLSGQKPPPPKPAAPDEISRRPSALLGRAGAPVPLPLDPLQQRRQDKRRRQRQTRRRHRRKH